MKPTTTERRRRPHAETRATWVLLKMTGNSASRLIILSREPGAREHLEFRRGGMAIHRRVLMTKYRCVCGYVYDPAKGDLDHGIKPGTTFEDLPADWVCPDCGLGKDHFEAVE